jgi:hypothetical protein
MPSPPSAPRRRPGLLLAGVLAAGLLGGCATATVTAPAPSPPALREMVRSELYFGLTRPGGGQVTEADWQRFLAEQVTPRFPDGLTYLEGNGQWRGASGVVTREPSRVLILIHEPGPGPVTAIEEIRALYRRQFDQESVLLTRAPVKVGF